MEWLFQSTRPRGARPGQPPALLSSPSCFNLHTRMERDAAIPTLRRFRPRFNPRARVGRDMELEPVPRNLPMFQSTRPRGARPEVFTNGLARYHVSIHAPVWGATCRVANTAPFNCLFQSTRPRGARHFPRRPRGNVPQCFNPRARVERDPRSLGAHPPRVLVSIHAPVWGATRVMERAALVAGVSIHAPVWGATRCTRPGAWVTMMFQSTRPCGARPTCACQRGCRLHTFQSTRPCGARPPAAGCPWLAFLGFNPRARVGRDRKPRNPQSLKSVFQSTRPCGARLFGHP